MADNAWHIAVVSTGTEGGTAREANKSSLTALDLRFAVPVPNFRGRRKIVDVMKPLLPGYILISCEPTPEGWASACAVDGVRRLLARGGTMTPATIATGFVDALTVLVAHRQADAARRKRKLFGKLDVKPGDRIVISTGRWEKLAATVLRVDSRRRIRILMTILGASREIEVDPANVVKIEVAEPSRPEALATRRIRELA